MRRVSFLDPLGLENLLKLNCTILKNTVHRSQRVNKQDFFIPRSGFWRSVVFNKGYMLSVCAERGRQWRKDSSEWRRIIEMHLESKLIFSAGQRTGYGNKKRDVIRFSGIWRVLWRGRGRGVCDICVFESETEEKVCVLQSSPLPLSLPPLCICYS